MRRLYFLRFPGGVHVARGVADLSSVEDLPRSDTWLAALLSVWKQVDRQADVEALAAAPPFRISSSLPWWRPTQAGPEPLLPAPARLFEATRVPGERRKELKRIRFLAPRQLAGALEGQLPPDSGSGLIQGGSIWTGRRDARSATRIYAAETTTRLAVDRLGGGPLEGMLFAFTRIRFATDCGIALVVELQDEALRPRFEAALQLLGYSGIGGDRTVGVGSFRFDPRESRAFELPDLGHGLRLLLSMVAPAREAVEEGLLDAPARYHIVERGGWVTYPGAPTLRRRRLRMLAEGAVLRQTRASASRAVCVLEPLPALGLPHRVFRGGPEVAVEIRGDLPA